jgi:hypothetical protein
MEGILCISVMTLNSAIDESGNFLHGSAVMRQSYLHYDA